MKFHTIKPCDNCPFLKENGIRLNKQRAEEIVQRIQEDGFVCHKTVDYFKEQGEIDPKRKQCGGSLILSIKQKMHNPFIRLHIGLIGGLPDLKGQELVFDTADEFIKANTND